MRGDPTPVCFECRTYLDGTSGMLEVDWVGDGRLVCIPCYAKYTKYGAQPPNNREMQATKASIEAAIESIRRAADEATP